jgi:hypothetical protein
MFTCNLAARLYLKRSGVVSFLFLSLSVYFELGTHSEEDMRHKNNNNNHNHHRSHRRRRRHLTDAVAWATIFVCNVLSHRVELRNRRSFVLLRAESLARMLARRIFLLFIGRRNVDDDERQLALYSARRAPLRCGRTDDSRRMRKASFLRMYTCNVPCLCDKTALDTYVVVVTLWNARTIYAVLTGAYLYVRVVQRELADRTVLPLALLLKVVVARAALINLERSQASSQDSSFRNDAGNNNYLNTYIGYCKCRRIFIRHIYTVRQNKYLSHYRFALISRCNTWRLILYFTVMIYLKRNL